MQVSPEQGNAILTLPIIDNRGSLATFPVSYLLVLVSAVLDIGPSPP